MSEIPTKTQSAQRRPERTPEEIARIQAAREQLQRERPSLADVIASGDVETLMSQGEYFDLVHLLSSLKRLREAAGWSLADVAARTGMDRAAISRLENGQVENPTIGTLQTLAFGLGKRLVVKLEDA
jgi:ribosome-binding protein aMBF1 (putative translation factor)